MLHGSVGEAHSPLPRSGVIRCGRVEDGRGGLGHSASPRFPSPLIERSVRISRTTLSDWLHRKAHDEARVRSRMSGGRRLRLAAELLPTAPGTSGVCRLSPITMPSPSSEAHQKSGSFPPPALPGLSSTMTLSDTRRSRRPATTSRPLPSPTVGLPQLPGSPFRHAVPTTPTDQDGCARRLLPRLHGLLRFSGGSASATSLSRPAQASLVLRPAGLLNRPRRLLSRGFDPAGCPTVPLVSYQSLPTTLWVVPSSTGEPRRWGARRTPGVPAPACGSEHGWQRPPRSPDAGPCASAAHHRSPV